jgi:hypothetical protein
MPVNRIHIMILLLALCNSCIEPFQPRIEEAQEVLVINGMITDIPGIHRVTISRSTPYNNASYMPVSGCVVMVENGSGQMAHFLETTPGTYTSDLDASFLSVGQSYGLFASTPDGNQYRSDYDTLTACPPIDSIYYEIKSQETADPDVTLYGLQFYNNVLGNEGTSSNYRWILEETWEYNAAYIADYIWRGGPVLPFLSDSIFTCYRTGPVKALFSASTRFLSVNSLKRNPLHYVSNETPKLKIKYSLLVEQQSLTNTAFEYWEQMESQSGQGGGLYETQPFSTIGNIWNVSDPEEKVLGCFYATQVQTKRYTVKNNFEFDVAGYRCDMDTIQSLSELESDFPYYLFSLSPMGMGPPYLTGGKQCFDCRMLGGTTEKPDFW